MHSKVISYLFNHVFLPGKLPQQDDYNPKYEIVLLDEVIEALRQFENHVSIQETDICSAAITAISRLKETYNRHGGVDKFVLTKALMNLRMKVSKLKVRPEG